MDAEYPESSMADDYTPTFYIGHHESKRALPISERTLRQAQDVGVSALLFPFISCLADMRSMIWLQVQ